ncbi:MAG: type II toxin-antitoxin system PemK/MazF family toxin [Clostridiales bacterium]|nr:type II toxin-antitoxin system PemK/MazF family toxin [Clostridiales bacterium]
MKRDIKRGDVYIADLNPVIGSEQGGKRPVLIISNNIGNYYSPTVICAAITSRQTKSNLPTHIEIKDVDGLPNDSIVLLEQIRTIDKTRLRERVASLNDIYMKRIEDAAGISLECKFGG